MANALAWGGALSSLFCALILLVLWRAPRLMLHHQPEAIRSQVAPWTIAEKRAAKLAALVGLGIVLCFCVGATLWLNLSPSQAFFHAAGMMLIHNLVDLFLIDWLIICKLQLRFTQLAGTENDPAYGDFKHHVLGFVQGLMLVVIMGAAASLAALING